MNIKKLALLTMLLLVAGLLVFNGEQTAAADDLSDGLVGYWKFDEGSGSIALDSSGYGNNGTINGGASYTSTGIAPTPGNVSALTFDGVDDFVVVPHADVLDVTAAYTISTWVSINNVTDYQTILSRGSISGNDIEVYWHPQGLTVVHNRGNRGPFDYVYFVSPSRGTLFHLAVVFDGTVVKAYYDGLPAMPKFDPALTAPLDTNKGWLIGRVEMVSNFPFWGLIDEMRIYNRALSESEIATLANPPAADLSITKTDSPDPVTVGSNLTYTITATNNGPDAATGAVVTDTLPSDVTFVSSSPSQGSCSGTSTVSCDLGRINSGASATVTIVVMPTVVGGISNTATITSSVTDPNTANNTATAVTTVSSPPTLSVSPTSLDFGNVTVNSTKDLTFTVTNSGGETLTGSVTASSPFSIVSGSSLSLGAGASQTVTVRFSPTTTGTFLSNANVSSNGGDTAVTLSGTGTPAPTLSVSTTSLDFGSVTVNSTKDLTFTVTNSGGGTLTGSVTASSPYSIVSGSSFSLTAGASQTVTVRFSPTTTGAFLGNANVSSNGGDTAVTLSGTGTPAPSLSVSTTSLDFGNVTVNSTKDLTFTVTNSGGGTLTGSVTASSPFSVISGSSFSLGAGASQTVTVRFSPTSTGTFTGTAIISSNGGSATVSLSGTGTEEQVPLLLVTPTSLDFGGVTVGSSSDLSFTVTNVGGGTLTGTATTNPPYSIVSGSSFSLSAGATQTVTVRFSPTSIGPFTDIVSVSSNGGSAVVALSGTGTEVSNPLLSVFPTSLSFGEVALGSSKDLLFTVTNAGSGTLTGTVTASSPFSITSGSSFSLGTGASQTITVRFSPTVESFVSSTAAVNSNGGNAVVALTGTGITIQSPTLSVIPTSLDFGSVQVGSSLDLIFFVQNSGGGTLVGTVSTSAPGFSIVSGNSFSLGAGASQTVTVRFSPTEAGTASGTVTVNSNGGGASVTVTGVGTEVPQPTLTVTPSILNFGSVRVGKSKDLSFTVQNTGEGTLAGTATATDPFSVVTNSSFTLEAGDLVLVTVRFSPPTTGPFAGAVEFASNGGNMTAAVTGRGRGKLLPFGLREAVRVAIDIQPDSKSNAIDCQSSGEIAVGILNVRELPSPIEVSTLELEGATPPQSWVTTDVDGDGAADDLVVHFKTQGVSDEACQEGAHSFFLTGELADGTPIEGWDEVKIVRGR